jgi:hypothetical protein
MKELLSQWLSAVSYQLSATYQCKEIKQKKEVQNFGDYHQLPASAARLTADSRTANKNLLIKSCVIFVRLLLTNYIW